MVEYVKQVGLLKLIPYLKILNSLPVDDGNEDELIFIPSAGIYMWRNDSWDLVMPISGSTPTIDSFVGEIKPYYEAQSNESQKIRTVNGSVWIKCDGTTYNYNDYPNLALLINNTLTPGSTFQVPDLRDKFLTMIGTNGVSNRFTNGDVFTLGEYKSSIIENHQHTLTVPAHTHGYSISHTHGLNNINKTSNALGEVDRQQQTRHVNGNGGNANTTSGVGTISFGSSTPTATLGYAGVNTSSVKSANTPKNVCCYYYIKAR